MDEKHPPFLIEENSYFFSSTEHSYAVGEISDSFFLSCWSVTIFGVKLDVLRVFSMREIAIILFCCIKLSDFLCKIS